MKKQTIYSAISTCLIAITLSSNTMAADSRILFAEETMTPFSYHAPAEKLQDDNNLLERSEGNFYLETVPEDLREKPSRPLFKPHIRSQIKRNSQATRDQSPEPVISAMSLAAGYTPLCPTLNINIAYTLNGTVTGGQYCYHFEITERAKTEAFLINQAVGTDFSMTLLQHEDNGSFSNLGVSDLAGNANESVLSLTENGQYYWLMTANSSNGSAFSFGAAANTAADDYELNETPATATVLSDGRNVVYGNMDGNTDVDYFVFTSLRGQNVEIGLDDLYGNDEWILELWNNGWVSLPIGSGIQFHSRLTSIAANTDVFIRVKPNLATPFNSSHSYTLTFGSSIDHIDVVDVKGESGLARISNASPSLTTQAHNLLEWSVKVFDSSNTPLAGVEAQFIMETEDISIQTYSALTDINGQASGMITLPDCVGNKTILHGAYGSGGYNMWLSTYDRGAWVMRFPEAMKIDEVGVGGDNVESVELGHICTQTLQ